MSLIARLKRLWELSGTMSHAEDLKMADRIQRHANFNRKNDRVTTGETLPRPATIIESTDPFEGIPSDEEEQHDSTNQ